MIIVPTAEMTVEATSPHIRWNPPLTEILARSVALLMSLFLLVHVFCLKLKKVVFITFGRIFVTVQLIAQKQAGSGYPIRFMAHAYCEMRSELSCRTARWCFNIVIVLFVE